MATTTLIPLHAGKGKTILAALGRTTDYVKNPSKTNGGEWVTAYECDPLTAAEEFLFSKRQYSTITGRAQGTHDVIAYHLRQSFKPGEIDPAGVCCRGCFQRTSNTPSAAGFIRGKMNDCESGGDSKKARNMQDFA